VPWERAGSPVWPLERNAFRALGETRAARSSIPALDDSRVGLQEPFWTQVQAAPLDEPSGQIDSPVEPQEPFWIQV
jgi:hypothetical protein